MPKRILAITFAAGALALAACNSNPGSLYGSATPTPGPTATVTPNPTASAALVIVTYNGSPLPNQPVTLSTPDANGHYTGAIMTTQTTDATGETTFSNLTPAKSYCFASTFQPTPSPSSSPSATPLPATVPICTNIWGAGSGIVSIPFNY